MARQRAPAWGEIRELAGGHGRELAVIAVLVSIGTLAALLEPWVYSAIIDDIAGLLFSEGPDAFIGRFAQDVLQTVEHVASSLLRIFSAPARGSLTLEARTLSEAFATVASGAVVMVAARMLSQACATWGDNRAARLGAEIERSFIARTYQHVLRLPLPFFAGRASGKVARQVDQSDQIAPIVTAVAQEIWPELFSLVAALVVMFIVDRDLAFITLVSVPVYALVTWRMSRAMEADLDGYYSTWEDVSARIQESIAGIKTVRAYGAAAHEVDRLNALMSDGYRQYLARTRVQNRYAFWQSAIIAASQAGILTLGGYQALQHELTPGAVVLFLTYLEQLYAPIESLTDLYARLQQHVGALRRARRLLHEPEAAGEERPPLRAARGAITVEHLTFGYDEATPVLHDLSFRIAAGERVALIGPSGAGKTTLTDLLAGLYQPTAGTIRIDGVDLTTVAPSSVQATVRGVAVDGMLFRGSLADNVRYGRFDASDDAVREAIERAGLTRLVERLPEGLETRIGERGVQLSAGERQRILLARALVARPTVLVLDEATANLDYRTEAKIKRALSRASEGRTTLVVAHRKSMLTDVDRVLVLQDGAIVQDGSPARLLEEEGYFRQLMEAADARA